jgi:hypothetical protein
MKPLALVAMIAIAVAGLGAQGCPPTPVPPPQPSVDAGPGPVDAGPTPIPVWNPADECGSTYARAQALGCALVSPKTGTWADACRNARAHGLVFARISCVRDAGTIEALTDCGISCGK